MRHLLILFILFGLFSCYESTSSGMYTKELPDSSKINEIISRVVQLDSVNLNANLILTIARMDVYSPDKSHALPEFGITFEKLFEKFNSSSDSEKRMKDSIFISSQTDSTRQFNISKELYSRFTPNPKIQFRFFTPIFSYDKKFVFVQYLSNNYQNFECRCIILNWTDNHWSKTDKWLSEDG